MRRSVVSFSRARMSSDSKPLTAILVCRANDSLGVSTGLVRLSYGEGYRETFDVCCFIHLSVYTLAIVHMDARVS